MKIMGKKLSDKNDPITIKINTNVNNKLLRSTLVGAIYYINQYAGYYQVLTISRYHAVRKSVTAKLEFQAVHPQKKRRCILRKTPISGAVVLKLIQNAPVSM